MVGGCVWCTEVGSGGGDGGGGGKGGKRSDARAVAGAVGRAEIHGAIGASKAGEA